MESKLEKPIWNLSVGEFLDIQKKELGQQFKELLNKAVSELKAENEQPKEDSINLEEACKVTGLKEKSIYTKVSRLEMPVISRGRPLMFSRQELLDWMRLGRPSVAEFELLKRRGRL